MGGVGEADFFEFLGFFFLGGGWVVDDEEEDEEEPISSSAGGPLGMMCLPGLDELVFELLSFKFLKSRCVTKGVASQGL